MTKLNGGTLATLAWQANPSQTALTSSMTRPNKITLTAISPFGEYTLRERALAKNIRRKGFRSSLTIKRTNEINFYLFDFFTSRKWLESRRKRLECIFFELRHFLKNSRQKQINKKLDQDLGTS